MSQLLHWFFMGGYSFYVWPAYGLVCLVLIANILRVKSQALSTRKRLQQWYKR